MKLWKLTGVQSGTLIAALLLASGCSMQVRVTELPPNLEAGAAVDGLPFRTPERYRIALYKLVDGEYKQVDIKEKVVTLANQDHLYVLKVKGSPLSDSTVTVKLRDDNTLEKVAVTTTSKGAESLSAIGKGVKDLSDARATRDKADKAAETAGESGRVSEEEQRIAALDAKNAAELAAITLDSLPSTATALERRTAEQNLEKAKIVANQKARKAGLPLPYPDSPT